MTREEAIRQLDGADIAVLNRDFFKFNQAIIMAISALRQQDHFRDLTKKVEPLTLDELRQMNGEPVYSVEITGREEWLFRRDGGFADMYGEFTSDDFMVWDNYGKLWWCYRRKPEEDDHA